jgi:FHS family L-fucose permease-like MFS transporter
MGVNFFGLGGNQEPSLEEIHDQQGRRPSAVEALDLARRRKSVADKEVTGASQITTRQSIVPVTLVTILFFLWVSVLLVLISSITEC